MKHLRLLTIASSLILQQAAWAGSRTYQQAQAIAERQAAKMGITISQQTKARSFSNATNPSSAMVKDALTSSGKAAYYVFPYGENKGFSIISGDDNMPELVAYSDKGTFDENNMPENCQNFLKAYKQMAEGVMNGNKQALKVMAQKRGLSNSLDYQQPTIAPLLGDIVWDTYIPFSGMCPGNCYASTAAVAMASIMKYWKYPKELKEDIPAYTSYIEQVPNEKYEIDQINKGEVYDWDNMLPYYNIWSGKNYNEEQGNAVAKLVAHCGAAIQTFYTSYNSVGFTSPEAFTKYFGYDPDMARLIHRASYSYSEWCKLIDQELIAKRPILYSGSMANNRYNEFVCDGADGKGLYHINWVQGSSYNGYYDIAILAPSISTDKSITSSFIGYNKDCAMIIGLQPDNGVKDEPLIQVQALSIFPDDRKLSVTKSERTSATDVFKLTYTRRLVNYQPEDFEGLIDIGYKNDKGNYVPLSKESSTLGIEGTDRKYSYWYTDPMDEQIEYAFPVGTTTLYDIYSIDGGKTWLPCAYLDGSHPYEVSATETTLTVVPENDDFQTTLKVIGGETLVGRPIYCSYTMHNENPYDYFGTVEIYYSNTEDFSSACPLNPDYVNIAAGGSTTHTISLFPEEEGDFYVWLYDVEHEKMLVNAQKVATIAPAPKVNFISKSINWKEDTYEQENAYYMEHHVAMPVIDGDEACVKYVMQNNGGSINVPIKLYIFAFDKDKESIDMSLDKNCLIEGNGKTTELEYRFKSSDLKGYRSFYCYLELENIYYDERDYSKIPEFKLHDVDNPETSYTFNQTDLVGYFRDATTGIAAIPNIAGDNIQITVGKGYLSLSSEKAQPIRVYNLIGQCVCSLSLKPNVTTTITLPSGIYVIGKKKVDVK